MVALGMCNIMGSFVLSMPVTGSFTRTAVNNASGVKTPLGGAVTGALVLMALAGKRATNTQVYNMLPPIETNQARFRFYFRSIVCQIHNRIVSGLTPSEIA